MKKTRSDLITGPSWRGSPAMTSLAWVLFTSPVIAITVSGS